MTMKGISLFSGAGIGEYYLNDVGIDIKVANEIIPKRADLYESVYNSGSMIQGDITDNNIYNIVKKKAQFNNVKFMIASPPCQGISVAGKNRKLSEMAEDKRNYLITHVIDLIKELDLNYILIENVPLLLKLKLLIDDVLYTVPELLEKEVGNRYIIKTKILNASDFGTAQNRKRAIILLYKKNLEWNYPIPFDEQITVRDVIGDLPSIESGDVSKFKWHFGRLHTDKQIKWMQHTPTGKSAFENEIHYPKKDDGTRVKGYNSSYRRIKWDEPAPTITIRNDAISSQRNVHPGKKLQTGLYSDARVLSILELMRLTGLPDTWEIPDDTPEILIRQVIGESIPPLLVKSLVKGLE